MKRDRAVWYYRRGGETHGPVSWAEIERVGAEDERLRVARAGDESWSTIAEVREQHPGLAIAGESRWRVIASANEDAETSDEVGERDWRETEDDEQDWIPHEASGAFVTWTFVGAALFWALPLVADRGLGGIEAIVASWQITRERYWLCVGLQVIVVAIGYLGWLTCFGWAIAMPYMSAFVACAYAWRFSEDYAVG